MRKRQLEKLSSWVSRRHIFLLARTFIIGEYRLLVTQRTAFGFALAFFLAQF